MGRDTIHWVSRLGARLLVVAVGFMLSSCAGQTSATRLSGPSATAVPLTTNMATMATALPEVSATPERAVLVASLLPVVTPSVPSDTLLATPTPTAAATSIPEAPPVETETAGQEQPAGATSRRAPRATRTPKGARIEAVRTPTPKRARVEPTPTPTPTPSLELSSVGIEPTATPESKRTGTRTPRPRRPRHTATPKASFGQSVSAPGA